MLFRRPLSALLAILLLCTLSACQTDVENDYKIPKVTAQGLIGGGMTGLAVGAAFQGSAPLSMLAGGSLGAGVGYLADSKVGLLYRLTDAGIPVLTYGDSIVVALPADNFFELDSAKLRLDHYHNLLDVAALLNAFPEARPVTIAAYTDNIGSDAFNYHLSEERAKSVLGFLWARGVDFSRLHAVAYGSDSPAAGNRTVLGNAMNRRVEIHFRRALKSHV